MDKVKCAVPNAFTLGNLAFGLISLILTFKGDFKLAALSVVAAAFMDRYDGRVARYLNVSSELGKELDSLADLVSFGVAPALLAFNMFNFPSIGLLGYVLVLLFPLSGAYRLARYNITSFDGVFTGVPITLAGMLIALYCFVITAVNAPHNNPAIIMFLMVALSYLMVSKHKMKKR